LTGATQEDMQRHLEHPAVSPALAAGMNSQSTSTARPWYKRGRVGTFVLLVSGATSLLVHAFESESPIASPPSAASAPERPPVPASGAR
jgi:hypothetical protein